MTPVATIEAMERARTLAQLDELFVSMDRIWVSTSELVSVLDVYARRRVALGKDDGR